MKKITLLLLAIAFVISFPCFGQVGIGTDEPKGALDIDSDQYGFVYPSVSLTSSIDQAPVVNPNGGSLAVGTTIFNDTETNIGINDVQPGIYSWDGSKWITHFFIGEDVLYEQTTGVRTSSNAGYVTVPINSNTFVPKHTGTYKIELKGYYGGGRVQSNRGMHTVMATGNFKLIFNGTDYIVDVKAFSSYHPDVGSGTHYFNVWKEVTLIKYVNVTAGISYILNLEFDQTSTQSNAAFQGRGNSSNGRGYVGTEVPCRIEFTYLNQ